jgi:membrane-associated PAP2 superfamily phosphatase
LYVVYYPGNVVTKERLKKILFRATNFLLTLPFFLVTLIKKNLQSAAIVIIIVVLLLFGKELPVVERTLLVINWPVVTGAWVVAPFSGQTVLALSLNMVSFGGASPGLYFK